MRYRMLAAAVAVSLAGVAAGPTTAADTPEGSAIFVPDPPPGKGQIVFFRPSAMGMAIACTVKEGETKVSSLALARPVLEAASRIEAAAALG